MSSFKYYLYECTKILATGENDVKNRLMLASTNFLIFANTPEDESVPAYFRDKHSKILKSITKKTWNEELEGDKIRATLYRMHKKTASKIAVEIWDLYNQYEEFLHSGFLPK